MDANNWRPSPPGSEGVPDGGDWRTQLLPESRSRIVNKIMDTLKRHLPHSGLEGMNQLKQIASRFEEKIYASATSQPDYLRKISVKMLTMETKSHANAMPTNSGGNGSRPPDPGMQPQIQNNQVQPIPNSLAATQSQAHQQMLQNIQSNLPSATVQGSASLLSTTLSPPGSTSLVGQTSSMQNANMQNNMQSGVSQNSLVNTMAQGLNSNMFVSQRQQMSGRQQQVVSQQQQQQQSQNPQQYLYQQQMQNQLMQQKMQQGNISHPMMTNQIQQQPQQSQQQNMLQQAGQLQHQQQSVMQATAMQQGGPLSGMQQNQQSSSVQQSTMLQHHQQLRHQQQQSQQAAIHQQQTALPQQITGQQATVQQQTQFSSQQNNMGEMQQQPQQQPKMMSQQNNNLQSLQQQQQQQMISQQNNLSNLHAQQQLAPQTNVSGLHQQMGTQPGNSSSIQVGQHPVHMLQSSKVSVQQQMQSGSSNMLQTQGVSGLHQQMGTQPGNSSSIQVGQHPVHMLQSSKVSVQQQMQSGSSNMLQTQGQQPQLQTMQQQVISQMQSQPGQLQQQQQVGLPQQQTSLQQRVQASGSLLQQQNMIDQQKQLFQSQRALPETSMESASSQPSHAGGGEWQEELYQKIKAMKDLYFPELNAMYQRISAKLQQHDSLPQQPKSDQIHRLKPYKQMLERLLSIMQLPKTELVPAFKDKLDNYEKQIVSLINMNKPRKMMQQSQMNPHHMSSMQPQQSQSQMGQVSSHENQMNPQMQTSMGLQNPVQPSSISSVPGVSNPQQTMMNSLQQHNPSMESGQGNAMGSMQQQVGVGSMQQNSAQQVNISTMSSQGGLTMLQPNNVNNLQTNLNMLQHQNLKHPEQHMQQQLKQQFQQRQMMLQQKQQLIQQHQQQLHQQQAKQQQQQQQQLPAQLQTHQMSQLHQMNEVADVKLRQGMGVKGVFQHQSAGSRAPYAHQQMKPGSSFPISSPQLLQVASPQLSQHSSPQIDQQNLLTSMTKAGTPLQSANSSFVVASPSTPLAPSPMPGDSEKPISGIQPHSNAGNMGHHHISSAQTVTAPSPAIGTPGISASPLLAEFSGPDGAHGNATAAAVSSKSTVTELPIERLMRVVKSLPSQSLSDAVTDISSVVSMVDRIAGSAPGNGSRAAVGEDLVAMTKCRLQARNFMLHDGPTGSRKMRRYTSAMPLNAASSAGSVNDSFKQSMGAEASDLESTATSSIKRPRIQGNHALMEQISEINQKLMDTVVDISNEEVDTCAATAVAEGGDGVIVKCSFNAVALSPELKSQYASAQLSPIQPLRLLVPSNYPHCSPILLDKFPVEVSREYEDLSGKAKTRFSICLRSLSQPMSLKDIARTWDDCCRAVILECAEKNGGGSFSSKYGTWESCVSAA